MRNLQFHLMVVAGIVVGVTGVFYLTGNLDSQPKKAAPVTRQIEETIWIEEANWGLNCATSYKQGYKELEKALRTANDNEYEYFKEQYDAAPPPPVRNNALEAVGLACNGQKTCEFVADWEFIANNSNFSGSLCSEPYQLEIRYRCKEFGRYHRVSASAYEDVSFSCPPTSAE